MWASGGGGGGQSKTHDSCLLLECGVGLGGCSWFVRVGAARGQLQLLLLLQWTSARAGGATGTPGTASQSQRPASPRWDGTPSIPLTEVSRTSNSTLLRPIYTDRQRRRGTSTSSTFVTLAKCPPGKDASAPSPHPLSCCCRCFLATSPCLSHPGTELIQAGMLRLHARHHAVPPPHPRPLLLSAFRLSLPQPVAVARPP